jgi:hypothetical protein
MHQNMDISTDLIAASVENHRRTLISDHYHPSTTNSTETMARQRSLDSERPIMAPSTVSQPCSLIAKRFRNHNTKNPFEQLKDITTVTNIAPLPR